MSFSLSEYTKIDVGPRPIGELIALIQTPSWFQGGRFGAGGEWRGREGRTRGRKGKRGKMGQ